MIKAIPLWQAAQAHIEKGLGNDRMDSMLKDLSAIIFLSRTREKFFLNITCIYTVIRISMLAEGALKASV